MKVEPNTEESSKDARTDIVGLNELLQKSIHVAVSVLVFLLGSLSMLQGLSQNARGLRLRWGLSTVMLLIGVCRLHEGHLVLCQISVSGWVHAILLLQIANSREEGPLCVPYDSILNNDTKPGIFLPVQLNQHLSSIDRRAFAVPFDEVLEGLCVLEDGAQVGQGKAFEGVLRALDKIE